MYKTTWNLSRLQIKENEKYIIKRDTKKFLSKWKNDKEYLVFPNKLLEALKDYENWKNNHGSDGDVGYFLMLRSQQDQNDPKIKASLNQMSDFTTQIENDMQFFLLRLAKIPKSKQKAFLKSSLLLPYKHFLEDLFNQSKYLLTEPEEKILNLKSQTSYANWVKMTSEFISKYEAFVLDEKTKKKVKKNFSEISSQMSSIDKAVRKDSATAFNEIQKKFADVAEHEINSILQNKKVDDELRKVDRPDRLRHLSDDIPSEIVDTVIDVVSNNFNISKDYYKLKAKLFSQAKLEYYDRNVPYGDIEKSYSFDESVELIRKVFKNLDSEFVNILDDLLNNGNVDVYPKKGKTHGAFCIHGSLNQPTYILLNHTNKLNDILTFAHELGHAINNELIKKSQNGLNFDTPLSTAEVSSTFMEDFVIQEFLKSCDDETKLSLMMTKLNDDVSTIFRQIAEYKFEQELHSTFRKKGYITKQEIGKIFSKHMKSYMGKYVKPMSGSENWWVCWSHVRSFFYVYSYASGLLISKALQKNVKNDRKFINKVKSFLSAGTSQSPQNIFLGLGISISKKDFWQNGINEIKELLIETEKLAKKLKKI